MRTAAVSGNVSARGIVKGFVLAQVVLCAYGRPISRMVLHLQTVVLHARKSE